MPEIPLNPTIDWLKYLEPFSSGLVVAASVLVDLGIAPEPQGAHETATAAAVIASPEEDGPALLDPWAFFREILGWEPGVVAGSPGGPPIPEALHVRLPEHDTTLAPTFAVRDRAIRDSEVWQLLVRLEPSGVGPDTRGALDGWEATPQQRLERLLRETGVPAGLLVTDGALRLVYAPKGETSGWLGFPLRPLATVAGRPMLGGLKRVLGRAALFTDGDTHRLPAILRRSRDEQSNVSTELAGQVLGALHELLRGLDAADAALMRGLAATAAGQGHLYEGLLAVLMRLVFILYAEDRGLLPSSGEARAREIYESSYSLRGLYGRLAEDAGLHPDTMNERRGGWGQLVALFRLVHGGYSGFVRRRGGKLFDPAVYPFLEGRAEADAPARVLPVSDDCVLRVLEGLMTLKGRGGARERLSYRTLDVEQIGSVYETVMGFTVLPASGPALAVKGGKNNRTPIYLDLAEIAGLEGEERPKRIKTAGRASLTTAQDKAVRAAVTVTDLAAALDGIVDERACPGRAVQSAGTPVLQPTDERRRTGSHYTPRSLTEPIVRYALQPAFERLGEEATAEQVLDLKVCDPAMGSGAFLVEACRQLGARLVRAWAYHQATPTLPPDEDADLHARRLVAQNCLYGVDKNPRAVDLAKLSLWLATLAADHEFTFLDHALREGDSLAGLNRPQIAALHWDESKPPTLAGHLVASHLREAEAERTAIRSEAEGASEADLRPRLQRADANLTMARLIGDGVIAAHFATDKTKKRVEALVALQKAVQVHLGSPAWHQAVAPLSAALASELHPLRPFHWPIEFPEVFSRVNPGFDAILGNPPFAGKNTIIAGNRDGYLPWLQTLHSGAHGNADLVSHFFRRSFTLLRDGGAFGLIATNTIGQGDTRDTGLAAIIAAGGAIFRATRRLQWPGDAAVVISVIHISKRVVVAPILDGRQVRRVSAYLVEGDLDRSPARLVANARKAFQGSIVLGMGFTFDDAAAAKREAENLTTMHALISQDSRNAERIFPYVGGEEITNHPRHSHFRYIIDFEDFTHQKCHDNWPSLISIVEKRVKKDRIKQKRKDLRDRWWQFAYRKNSLYEGARHIKTVFAINCGASPHMAIARLCSKQIFANTLNVFLYEELAFFACCQSRIHEVWTRFFASSMKDDLRYTPSDCFETFPFPRNFENIAALEDTGRIYHDNRAALMIARDEGMTKTYNRFHDHAEQAEDIARLRDLHDEMDRAVLASYGWDDLAARAGAQWLDEENEPEHSYQGRLFWPSAFRDEVLGRLLAVNAERAAAERAAGLVAASSDEADNEAA
ncbi:Eco57I restriction-modification methylase domain-containing protein [Methylobacterium sp. CM6246]